jgi:hypothetical protein
MVRINELMRCWRRFGNDAQPSKWIRLLVDTQRPGGNGRPADAMEAVAAADKIANDLVRLAAVFEANARRLAIEIVDADVTRLE